MENGKGSRGRGNRDRGTRDCGYARALQGPKSGISASDHPDPVPDPDPEGAPVPTCPLAGC